MLPSSVAGTLGYLNSSVIVHLALDPQPQASRRERRPDSITAHRGDYACKATFTLADEQPGWTTLLDRQEDTIP
jgi:hypothetical protein